MMQYHCAMVWIQYKGAFKYYISALEGGGGSRPSLISLMQGGGVQKLEKCADVILERSLMLSNTFDNGK